MKVAAIYDIHGNLPALEAVLRDIRDAGVPTHPYENVYPMIPAGGCNHEMILDDPPELKLKQSGSAKVTPQDKDTILTA